MKVVFSAYIIYHLSINPMFLQKGIYVILAEESCILDHAVP